MTTGIKASLTPAWQGVYAMLRNLACQ